MLNNFKSRKMIELVIFKKIINWSEINFLSNFSVNFIRFELIWLVFVWSDFKQIKKGIKMIQQMEKLKNKNYKFRKIFFQKFLLWFSKIRVNLMQLPEEVKLQLEENLSLKYWFIGFHKNNWFWIFMKLSFKIHKWISSLSNAFQPSNRLGTRDINSISFFTFTEATQTR